MLLTWSLLGENLPKLYPKMIQANCRENKTIESAVAFPAPERGENRGLSPFYPRKIIVIGDCPFLCAEEIYLFVPVSFT